VRVRGREFVGRHLLSSAPIFVIEAKENVDNTTRFNEAEGALEHLELLALRAHVQQLDVGVEVLEKVV
jgi:hypothetical protein